MASGYRLALLAAAGFLVAGLTALGMQVLTHDPPAPPADRPAAAAVKESPRRSPPISTPTKHKSHPPTATPLSRPAGPTVPATAIGSDAKRLEEALKGLGFDAHKVDVDSAAPKDSVIATIPGPGELLAAEQTVIVVASKGEPADEPADVEVPAQIVGAEAGQAEDLLKDLGLHVEKVDIDSTLPEDTVVTTYPAPGDAAFTDTVILAIASDT